MSLIARIRVWARGLFNPASVDSDLDREMRAHLAMEAEHLEAAGMDAAEARRQAAINFGTVLRFREEARDERTGALLEDLFMDTRYALRAFRRAPAFFGATTLVLALGIGAATTVGTIAGTALFRPLPFPEANRLTVVLEASKEGEEQLVSFPNFMDWKARSRTLSDLAATFSVMSEAVVVGGDAVRATTRSVSRDYFGLFDARPLAGRTFAEEDARPGAPPVAIVGEAFWREALGGRPLGTSLTIKRQGELYVVVGVLPRSFRVTAAIDVWLPLERSAIDVRGAGNYQVIGRLAPGVTIAAARQELNVIARDLAREHGEASVTSAVAMTALQDRITVGARRPLLLLLVASAVVLVATCASVGLMLVARGVARHREMTLRAALGAKLPRLVRQLAAEVALIAVGASVGGHLVTWLGLGVARRYGGDFLPRLHEVAIDGRTMLVALGATLLAGLLSGSVSIAPTILAPRRSLGGGDRSTPRARAVDRLLIGAQAAAGVLLISGATLLIRGVQRVIDADVGYDRRGLISVQVPLASATYDDLSARLRMARLLQDSLRGIPGVTEVALASLLPNVVGGNHGPVLVPPFGDPTAQSSWAGFASFRVVSPNYFAALKIPVLRGRALTDADGPDAKVVVVNRALAEKLWPGKDPLGQSVRALVDNRADTFSVVGVVGNARVWWADIGQQQELYATIPQRPQFAWQIHVVLRSALPASSIGPEATRRVRALDPEILATVRTLDQIVDETVADRRFISMVIGAFGLVVLILTTAGVFGSVAYAVERRTREVGIRLAVGAGRMAVWRMVQRDVVVTALIGSAAGVLLALGTTKLLAGLLYEISPRDPVSLAFAVVASMGGILAAAAIPAARAVRIDPVLALRAE